MGIRLLLQHNFAEVVTPVHGWGTTLDEHLPCCVTRLLRIPCCSEDEM